MDTDNPVVQLCIQGTQAEYARRYAEAAALYRRAWELASDDYEACIAAHYVARLQPSPQDALHWDQEALKRAGAVQDGRVQDFYPSLYLSLGRSYELLGDAAAAQHFYDRAAALGFPHAAEND